MKKKLLIVLASVLTASLLGLGTWVVDKTYDNKRCVDLVQAQVERVEETVVKDVKELKEDINDIKWQLQVQNEKMQQDKDKWFNILLDIKKATKENNK